MLTLSLCHISSSIHQGAALLVENFDGHHSLHSFIRSVDGDDDSVTLSLSLSPSLSVSLSEFVYHVVYQMLVFSSP